MKRTILEVIGSHGEKVQFRQAFLRSGAIRQLTLADVLANPSDTLDQIRALPNVGEVTLARLRRMLSLELAEVAPLEWQAASQEVLPHPAARPAGFDAGLAGRIAKFRSVWSIAEESWPIKGAFHSSFADDGNSVYSIGLAETEPFTYAPLSFPEILKTAAVFHAEQGGGPAKRSYHSRLTSMRKEEIRLPAGSLILMDRLVLSDLLGCRGQYATLTPDEAAEQIEILADYLLSDRHLRVAVTDFRKHGLSSGYCTTKGPLFHFCFGGYLELRSSDICAHFLRTARSAERAGVTFRAWIDHLGTPTDAQERRSTEPRVIERIARAGIIAR